MTSTIKFNHIRDPKNPKRVVTVARTIDIQGDEQRITFAFATNHPSTSLSTQHSWLKEPSDQYRRKVGNYIATQRLVKRPLNIAVDKSVNPMAAILKFVTALSKDELADLGIPMVVVRVLEEDNAKRLASQTH